MKNKKLIIVSAAVALAAGGVAVGGTYALFTSNTEHDVYVQSGTIAIATKAVLTAATSGEEKTDMMTAGNTSSATFQNGGTVSVGGDGTVTVSKITPMDAFSVKVSPTNKSNVNIKYRLMVSVSGELANGVKITVDGVSYSLGQGYLGEWTPLAAETAFAATDAKTISVEMPKDAGNEYQNKNCSISMYYDAVQGNATTGYKADAASKTLEIYDENGMKYWDENSADYLDYTIKLEKSRYDLGFMNWNPLGYGDEIHGDSIKDFKGSLEGNGAYLNNLRVFKDAVTGDTTKTTYGYGFFASLGDGAKVSNVTFNSATIMNKYRCSATDASYLYGNITGVVAGYAKGAVTLKNVNSWNNTVYGYGKVGALLGMASGGPVSFTAVVSMSNKIHATYNAGGLIGTVARKSGADIVTLDTNSSASYNTFTMMDYDSAYKTYSEQKATFTSDDTATGTAVEKSVSGTYWTKSGSYWYGGHAEKYVSLGLTSYDAPFVGTSGMYFANSELVVD